MTNPWIYTTGYRHKKIPDKCLSGSLFIYQPNKSLKYWTVCLNTRQLANGNPSHQINFY